MDKPIKIVHIDPEYKVNYFIYYPGYSVQSTVDLEEAISLLKTVDIDLILSEPLQKAILNHQNPEDKSGPSPEFFLALFPGGNSGLGRHGPGLVFPSAGRNIYRHILPRSGRLGDLLSPTGRLACQPNN
jgi:hypothetical protein